MHYFAIPAGSINEVISHRFQPLVVGIDGGVNGGYEPCTKHFLIPLGKGFKSLHMFHLPMFKSVRNLALFSKGLRDAS